MNEYKLVFTGAMGAGKTTAIEAISEVPIVNTDVSNTDYSSSKLLTTVGLDYGLLELESGDRVRLFGTPGQSRFDFMWKILVKDAFGIIILIDNSSKNPLDDLSTYLAGLKDELAELPCVVGLGRTENHPEPKEDDYAELLKQHGLVLPIIPMDARRKEDVILLIDLILAQRESLDLD